MDEALTFIVACLLSTQANCVPLVKDTSDRVGDSLRFLVIADWGGKPKHPYKTEVQVAVAEQMAITAERENTSFILSLGDNIYIEGVRSPRDSRFQTTFEEVYHHASLHIPWYIIAGNHDYYGHVMAQISYSQFSARWVFPNYYYKVRKHIPGGKTMDILLLDTRILCGHVYFASDGRLTIGNPERNVAEEEWNWIEQNLKDSDADYLLVVGHYPVYSVGKNGPTDCLIQRLEPLLYENHVTAYLSGHDHNLQHFRTTKGTRHMDYFVTGSGAFIESERSYLHSVPENSLKFIFSELGGFAFVDVSSAAMNIKFIDSSGSGRYEHAMGPRGDSNR